jgi:hypothetical protein
MPKIVSDRYLMTTSLVSFDFDLNSNLFKVLLTVIEENNHLKAELFDAMLEQL